VIDTSRLVVGLQSSPFNEYMSSRLFELALSGGLGILAPATFGTRDVLSLQHFTYLQTGSSYYLHKQLLACQAMSGPRKSHG
jgi:hypothetical protein